MRLKLNAAAAPTMGRGPGTLVGACITVFDSDARLPEVMFQEVVKVREVTPG